jgi:hypothetical protein
MRITHSNINDFCEELAVEAKAGRVHRSEVWTRIDRAPEQDEKITFLIVLWATVAITTPEGDFVMEFGAECGSDDRRNPDGGTTVALGWLAQIKGIAEGHDLTVRKGKLEIY